MYGLAIILLQILIYHFFLRPIITRWGASKEEVSMSMDGDEKFLVTKSTRAISIFAEKSDVWKWLIQLGADRCGFYSYSFIENLLGYKTRHQDFIRPEFQEINVGDIVRGSIDEKSSIIPYNFRVLDVQPESTLVLEKWGTFSLKKISNQETRLVIRTRENKASSIYSKAFSYIMIAFHYLMERRTLIGIKTRVESGEGIRFSQASDILWFLGVVLSELLILSCSFTGYGIVQAFIYPLILSLIWLFSVFIFKPVPLYGVGLFFLCVAILVVL